MGQPDLTHNTIDLNPFLTFLKWPVFNSDPFDPQPDWLDPTRPARFVMSTWNSAQKSSDPVTPQQPNCKKNQQNRVCVVQCLLVREGFSKSLVLIFQRSCLLKDLSGVGLHVLEHVKVLKVFPL